MYGDGDEAAPAAERGGGAVCSVHASPTLFSLPLPKFNQRGRTQCLNQQKATVSVWKSIYGALTSVAVTMKTTIHSRQLDASAAERSPELRRRTSLPPGGWRHTTFRNRRPATGELQQYEMLDSKWRSFSWQQLAAPAARAVPPQSTHLSPMRSFCTVILPGNVLRS